MVSSCIVLAVHGSAPFIGETMQSIKGQTRAPDGRIAIMDDASASVESSLKKNGFAVARSTSTAKDTTTRIAQNFLQGVRAAREFDVVILGDHDDVWHPTRIERHLSIMEEERWLMTAADGVLVDATGQPMGTSLRDTFPVPSTWNTASARSNLRYALRHSVATGGASAIRTRIFAEKAIPPGWLHDRWWSLLATKRGALHIDREPVIDYRVTDLQQVGLRTSHQDRQFLRLLHKVRDAPTGARRARDVWTRL